MEQIFSKQVALDIGTVDLRIALKFTPNGMSGSDQYQTNPVTTQASFQKRDPATDNQKRALTGMARRLGREINLDQLSKREASNLIDKFGAELRRS